MPKNGLLVINPQNRQTLGTPIPDSHLDSMKRKCAKTLLPLNIFG